MAGSGFLYTFFTAFGVILIGTGLALQILYVERYEETENWGFAQIGSLTINTLVVCYIMFMIMFYRPFEREMSVALSAVGLLAGLALEIYSTQIETNNVTKIFSYMLSACNALIRLYLLISVRCDKYLTTVSQLIEAVPQVAKSVGKPVQDVVKDVGAQAQEVDLNRLYGNVMSGLGSIVPEDKKNEVRDIVKKSLGLPPRVQQAGRRR